MNSVSNFLHDASTSSLISSFSRISFQI